MVYSIQFWLRQKLCVALFFKTENARNVFPFFNDLRAKQGSAVYRSDQSRAHERGCDQNRLLVF
jgi:hypothetical protein